MKTNNLFTILILTLNIFLMLWGIVHDSFIGGLISAIGASACVWAMRK